MNKMNASNFWLNEDLFDDQIDILDDEPKKRNAKDPIKLASYRNAIANFVRIVTGEDIPVTYTSNGSSYTDGKKVVISSSIKEKDFDSTVGLALHEGSHVKLTDFNMLNELREWISRKDSYVLKLTDKHVAGGEFNDRFHVVDSYIYPKLKDLINIIEDRRIDHWVYTNAPGYRGYYDALYAKYFNAPIIDKGLKSDEYTSEDWDSYMFRIINITNPNRRLDALTALKNIWSLLDLKNITRLKNTYDVRDLAWQMFQLIEAQIPKPEPAWKNEDDDQNGGSSSDEKGEGEDQGQGGSSDSKASDEESSNGDDVDSSGSGQKSDGLSDRQKAQLDKAIDKQKQFSDGSIRKTKVSKKLQESLAAVEESGMEIKKSEWEKHDYWMESGQKMRTDVTVIRRISKSLMEKIDCDMWFKPSWIDSILNGEEDYSWSTKSRDAQSRIEMIHEAIRKGTTLGKKLKVRSEERSTKFNRMRSGRIDKRMLAQAGGGYEAIFQRIESMTFRPGMIHISIDASGSMSGSRFENAIETSIMIAKACSMIDNIDCVISFRAGVEINRGDMKPVMMIGYDSRVNSMNHIKSLFTYLRCPGTTPEGLCFDAIMDEIIADSRGKDSYFINISDGMPSFANYHGESALLHTAAQVRKMKANDIKVLSFYVDSGYRSEYAVRDFKKMYGQDARFIEASDIRALAKSMNEKFLAV